MRHLLMSIVLCSPALSAEENPLAQFVQDAIASSDAVLAAEAALSAAKERRLATQQSYDNPELFIDMEEIDPFSGSGDRRTVIGMAKRFDLHGKRKARMTVAEANEQVARAELDGVRTAAAEQLLNALAGWRTATNRVALLQAHDRTMANFVLLSERQRKAGDISQMEVNLAKLAKAKTNMALAAAETELAMAVGSARYATRVQDERLWPEFDFGLPQLNEITDSSVSSLPDVRVALLKAEVAAAGVGVTRRERRPDPTISMGIGTEAGERLTEIGVSLPLNVLDRGTYGLSAAVAEARAATRAAEDVIRLARVRREASAERYRIAWRTWNEWLQEGEQSLGDREELAKKSWEVGELEPADYLVHSDAVIELRMQALDVRQSAWIAWFEWLIASQNIDEWLGIDTSGEGLWND